MSGYNDTTTECDTNFVETHRHPNCSIKATGTKNGLKQFIRYCFCSLELPAKTFQLGPKCFFKHIQSANGVIIRIFCGCGQQKHSSMR